MGERLFIRMKEVTGPFEICAYGPAVILMMTAFSCRLSPFCVLKCINYVFCALSADTWCRDIISSFVSNGIFLFFSIRLLTCCCFFVSFHIFS